MTDDLDKLTGLKRLEYDTDWRVKKSTFLKEVINEWTRKQVLYEVDIATLQRKLLVISDAKVSGELNKGFAENKLAHSQILEVLQTAENLLVDALKEEAKLKN
jgi:hypothetical protein